MKLHRNRKRNKSNKLISLALVCCMTLSVGSSYVSAGELGAVVENGEVVQESQAEESVTPSSEGTDNQNTDQNANNTEESPSDMEQSSVPAANPTQQGNPSDGTPPGADIDVTGEPADNGNQGAGDADPANGIADDGSTSNPAENENTVQGGTSADAEQPADKENQETGDTDPANGITDGGSTSNPAENENTVQGGTSVDAEQPADKENQETGETTSDASLIGDTFVPTDTPFSFGALSKVPNDAAEAGCWILQSAAPASLDDDEIEEPSAEQTSWNFSAYYINEDDKYSIVKEEANFSLKYQMEFWTNETLIANAVQIKVEKDLFLDRKENSITQDEVGIPAGTPDKFRRSARTPFNYYVDGDYLIFFNYMPIAAGTHAAWQVLYKNLKMMSIRDGQEWSLTPEISVYNQEADTESDKAPLYSDERRSYKEQHPLTGRADAHAYLVNVKKSPYSIDGKKYTPGLYTMRQLNEFVTLKNGDWEDKGYKSSDIPDRLNTDKWHFVVWKVEMEVDATLPWVVEIEDTPTAASPGLYGNTTVTDKDGHPVQGEIVGWQEISPKAEDPAVSIQNTGGIASVRSDLESWKKAFLVVTAYPAEVNNEQIKYLMAQNEIAVTLKPAEDENPEKEVTKTAKAEWFYEEYDWTYSGDVFRVYKEWKADESTNKKEEYAGWLDTYRAASALDEDFGSLPYHTKGLMKGYKITHDTEGDSAGAYIPGTYYTMTTIDDYLSAEWTNDSNINRQEFLTEEDYYFSSVKVIQKDCGYDVWEDQETCKSDLTGIAKDSGILPKRTDDNPVFCWNEEKETYQSEVRIWAKFSEPAAGQDAVTAGAKPEAVKDGDADWELVDSVWMDANSPEINYIFSEDLIVRKPYRILVEHDSIDYRSECHINTTVRLKAGSPVLQKVLQDMGEIDRTRENANMYVRLEGLAGIIAATTLWEGDRNYYGHSNGAADDNELVLTATNKDDVYDGRTDELESLSGNAYICLPVRESDYCKLKWLAETAASFKTAKTSNDADNSRVLVDYCLTAYDGYEIYDNDGLNYLTAKDKSIMRPGRNNVVFYDLLPKGMSFDASVPVKAGRIKQLDKNSNYTKNPGLWDAAQVEVTVDADEIDSNYRGTGRTLVVFRIAYSGADSSFYTDGKWLEGWGVSFRAYYDWKDGDAINKKDVNANLSAFMPDFSKDEYEFNYDNPKLHGLSTQVYCDNGEFKNSNGDENEALARIYGDLVTGGGGLHRIGRGTQNPLGDGQEEKILDNRNVLYANNVLQSDDMAMAYTGGIETLVKADADLFGTFKESAWVPTGTGKSTDGLYTYNITVTAAVDQKNIVVFDRLEKADVDKQGGTKEPYEFTKVQADWWGNFRSLDVSGLEKLGINPVKYYNKNDNPEVPKSADDDPGNFLKEENGWYTEARFIEEFGENGENWQEQVKAVAVDLTNTGKEDEKGDPVPYILKKDHSLSLQIRMKTEGDQDNKQQPIYTYNNASYTCTVAYATSAPENRWAASTAARVGKSQVETLEVVKRFGREVPSSLQNKSFAFTLYEKTEYQVYDETTQEYKTETREQPLAYAAYRITNADGTPQTNQVKSTDGNGTFYLRTDEKAVFEMAYVDKSRIRVQEKEDIFWTVTNADVITEQQTTAGIHRKTRTVTFTNTYRPVLYLEKDLAGMPSSDDWVRTEESAETLKKKGIKYKEESGIRYIKLTEEVRQMYEFRFLVERKTGSSWQAVPEVEYWYVDSVRQDGGSPMRVDENGNVPEDGKFAQTKTDENGYLTLHSGQTIALFPGYVGTEYRITEENTSSDWTIEDSKRSAEGTLEVQGSSETFTNYYKWKNLYLKKKLEDITEDRYNQLPSSEREFTFKVEMVEEPQPGSTTASADGLVHTPVSGLKWQLLDKDGKPAETGELESDGSFSCAAGFATVRIVGLEAGRTYIVKETGVPQVMQGNRQKALYRPVSDTAEVWVSPWGNRREAEIVNRYLRRSLSVSKTVMKTETDDQENNGASSIANLDFTFLAEINGAKLPAETMYTVTDRNGETHTEGPLGNEGIFTLKDGQTAFFQDAGLIGDRCEVWEQVVTDENDPRHLYQQVTPAEQEGGQTKEGYGAPGFGNFSESILTARISFANLYGEGGNLLISKEYVVGSNAKKADLNLLEEWKVYVRESQESIDKQENRYCKATDNWLEVADSIMLQQLAVDFTLEVKRGGEDSYIWPGPQDCDIGSEGNSMGGVVVKYFNQMNSKTGEIFWPKGETIKVYPWVTIIVPGEKLQGAEYTLKEEPGSQHRMWRKASNDTYYPSTGGRAGGNQTGIGGANPSQFGVTYIQVSQSGPENDQAVTGTLAEKSVATIYNEVAVIVPTGTTIVKEMLPGSNEVSPGAKLVYRVEKYEDGMWVPAEGIKYLKGGILQKDTNMPRSARMVGNIGSGTSIDMEKLTSTKVETTGKDGKIVVSSYRWEDMQWAETGKPVDFYPAVQFLEDVVFVNQFGKNDNGSLEAEESIQIPYLRIVELQEESSGEWGYLAGYNMMSLRLQGFVNSNVTSPVEIAKNMTEGYNNPDEPFTMVLKQVVGFDYGEYLEELVSLKRAAINNSITMPEVGDIIAISLLEQGEDKEITQNYVKRYQAYEDIVTAMEPRSGISYTIHEADGKTVGSGITRADGGIEILAGQYVTVNLPVGTLWTVTEKQDETPNYKLADLDPKPGSASLIWLNNNLMMINMRMAGQGDDMLEELVHTKR